MCIRDRCFVDGRHAVEQLLFRERGGAFDADKRICPAVYAPCRCQAAHGGDTFRFRVSFTARAGIPSHAGDPVSYTHLDVYKRQALASPSEIIFLLCGNIFNLQEIVERANRCGKDIYVHVDLRCV